MTASSHMSLTLVGPDQRSRIASLWRGIEAAAGERPFACGWDWTETWLEHYGDIVEHRFALGERAGSARAVALVTVSAGSSLSWLRPRTLRVGTAGEPRADTVWVEHNGLLALPGERDAFAAALMAKLRRLRGWDRLELDGFLPDHARALQRAEPRLMLSFQQTPVAELSPDQDVVERLPSSARRRARQTMSRFGELELEWAAHTDPALAILDELAVLHGERHRAAGRPGAFASARFSAFHRALIRRLGDRAALVRIRRGGETVGCLYGLVDRRRMLFYQSGLRRYEDNKLRAGTAVHVMFMRACTERGFRTYDFLAPPDRYKRELSTDEEELVWGSLDRFTPRTRLWAVARQLRAAARGNAISSRRSSVSREMSSSTPR